MVFIPPPHVRHDEADKPLTQHQTTTSLFLVFVIAVVIALVVFIVGPLTDNPPPLVVGLSVIGFALLFGVIAFFSWMKEQSEPDADDGNHKSSEQ